MNPHSSFDITAPFLRVAPAFRSRWEAFLQSWESEEEASMYTYLAMDELAHFLVDSYEKADTGSFPDVFRVIEDYLETGDEELENLVQVGIFETLQNVASHRSFGFKVFERWLEPRARPVWKRADEAMTLVANMAAASASVPWWQFWKRRRKMNPEKALLEVENPKLRKILESEYRRRD